MMIPLLVWSITCQKIVKISIVDSKVRANLKIVTVEKLNFFFFNCYPNTHGAITHNKQQYSQTYVLRSVETMTITAVWLRTFSASNS